MKWHIAFLPVMILVQACAVTYYLISGLPSVGSKTVENEDLKLSVGIQPLGKNHRFKDRADENGYAVLCVKVESKNQDSVLVAYENFKVSIGADVVSPATPHEVASDLKLKRWPYWLYGFIWFGYRECNGNDCNGFWFPIGLIPAIANFSKATSSNNKMTNDFKENAFRSGYLSGGQSREGLLFLRRQKNNQTTIQLFYTVYGKMKDISIPYNF